MAKTGSICPTFKQKTRHIACLPTSYLIDFMLFRWTKGLFFRQTTVPTVIFRGGIIPTEPHITIYILISYILYIRVIVPHFLIVVTVYCRILNWVSFSLQGPMTRSVADPKTSGSSNLTSWVTQRNGLSLWEKRPLAMRETASRCARNAVLPSEKRPTGYVTYVMCH